MGRFLGGKNKGTMTKEQVNKELAKATTREAYLDAIYYILNRVVNGKTLSVRCGDLFIRRRPGGSISISKEVAQELLRRLK